MSQWISLSELLVRWRIQSFEIFDYFEKGLQPYSRNGITILCPPAHHAHRHRSNELTIIRETLKNMKSQSHHDQSVIEDILPVSESEIPTDDASLDDKRIEELKEQEAKVLEEWKAIEDDDPGFSSWKYFVMPTFDQDVENLLEEVRDSFYRLEDIEEFEKEHDLDPVHEAGAEKTKSISGGKVEKKLSHRQIQEDECRGAARKIWDEDETVTVVDMYNRKEIINFTLRLDGERYKMGAFRGWVKDLNPNRKPGRRPKKKA